MAYVKDLWHSAPRTAGPDGKREKAKTARHPDRGGNPRANRWQAVWVETDGRERAKTFTRQADAERYAARMEAAVPWCLVPECGRRGVTEPPVLLCEDHRDAVVAEATRKRPSVHPSLVYFIRNGSRIKIGWTTNLRGRLTALSLPQDAVLLTAPGGPAEEKALHRKFGAERVGRSEWFEATPRLEAFIATEAAEWLKPARAA